MPALLPLSILQNETEKKERKEHKEEKVREIRLGVKRRRNGRTFGAL